MKSLLALGALVVTLLSPSFAAANGYGHGQPRDYVFRFHPQRVIYVSCYRGPWREVIWDRPNAVFVDSLVGLGYDWPTAHAISERICRDDALVFNPGGLESAMRRIYYSSSVYRTYGY